MCYEIHVRADDVMVPIMVMYAVVPMNGCVQFSFTGYVWLVIDVCSFHRVCVACHRCVQLVICRVCVPMDGCVHLVITRVCASLVCTFQLQSSFI